MNGFILKGNICDSASRRALRIRENSFLVCEDGRCSGVFDVLPETYRGLPVLDFGQQLILPGMTDLHLHAPQYSFRGLGMDLELLDWLNTYTFPEEARYASLDYASRAYAQFAANMRRSATTRACIFATIHPEATVNLMDQMELSGLKCYVGKVNMDRNCPADLCERSAQAAVEQTEQWIADTCDRYENVRPILTPRFIPSCTDALMQGLRQLQKTYGLPVQSHLSENFSEIAWVQQLCPSSRFYADAYDQFGLLGGDYPCIMAHCVHSCKEEVELLRQNGVYVAHSPESNMNLASGVAPISHYLDLGLRVGLATDVAGGCSESMFRAIARAIQASKLRWRLLDSRVRPLSLDEAFYLATAGGGAFFGKVGRFEPGYELDAVVLDDGELEHPQELSVRARLERAVYLAGKRHVRAKFVAGKRLI